MTENIKEVTARLDSDLGVKYSFDLINRKLTIGGREAVLYFIDGFIKDEVFEKIIEFFFKITPDELLDFPDMTAFAKIKMPYVEVDTAYDYETIETAILSGPAVLVIDGVKGALIIDTRTYPSRSIEEPQKDRSLRGSRDGFVETLIFNTSMIRRRIRDKRLRMEYMSVGTSTKLDIAICYMDTIADKSIIEKVKKRLKNLKIKGISMTAQALSEAMIPGSSLNPYPRIKVTERPDYASACILEGKIGVVMDNSPGVMLLPVSFSDFTKEVDDYYFPPVTGTYVRIVRLIISFLTIYLTPVFLWLSNNPYLVPENMTFVLIQNPVQMPVLLQLLILEVVVDGLRIASLNTPDSLSNAIGILGALLLSEFAINSGWFATEVILYMAFVTISSFTQASFEMGYAQKFQRVLLLILTQFFGIWGILAGTVIGLLVMGFTKTMSGRKYLYPVIPFDKEDFLKLFVRTRITDKDH